jgi:hypothetical protein
MPPMLPWPCQHLGREYVAAAVQGDDQGKRPAPAVGAYAARLPRLDAIAAA